MRNLAAHLFDEGDYVALHYLMDMREASDAAFIAKLDQYRRDGNPINEADIKQQISQGSLGKTIDMTPFEFRRLKADMPYLKQADVPQ